MKSLFSRTCVLVVAFLVLGIAPIVSVDASDFVSTSTTATRTTPNPFENLIGVVKDAGNQIKDTVASVIDKVTDMVTGTSNPETINTSISNPTVEITEQDTDTGKLVTISSPDENPETPLVDVLASTTIPEIYKVGEEDEIHVKWKNEGDQEMVSNVFDTDEDGYLDHVEWTVPHLSTQVFEVIFISKAFQLDADKNITADIYETVAVQDQNYATVPQNNYVRVTFNTVLDNTNDITVYGRPAGDGQSANIEVRPVYIDADGNQTQGNKLNLVNDGINSDFSNIDHDAKYRILLSNLQTPTDTFDLKVVGGNIDFDYIVDPTTSITISSGADTCALCWDGGSPTNTYTATGADVINATTLANNLSAGNVVLTGVTDNITVSSAVTKASGGDTTLTMYAGENIIVSADITSSSNKLNLLLNADRDANSSGYINIAGALTSNGGDITMGGGSGTISAGTGFAVGNAGQVTGIFVNNKAVSAGGGNIIANGQGFNTTTNNNYGVRIYNVNGLISTTGLGNINIVGNGAGNTNSGSDSGVFLDTGGVVSAVNGNLTVVGTAGGAGSGNSNNGVYVYLGNGAIKTTGSGNIVVTGTGGDLGGSGVNNYGVNISTINGIQASGTGAISVTGNGGNGSGGGNVGFGCGSANCIQPNSTGSLSIMGTAGSVGNFNYGISLGAGFSIIGSGAEMNIIGIGGNSSGRTNLGIVVTGAGATISNSGTGTLSITGTGGGNTDSYNNHGVYIAAAGVISTVDGDLTTTGSGGGAGTGASNQGVYVADANSAIKTTGLGNLSVTGNGGNLGGTGGGNIGVYVYNAGSIYTGVGNLAVVGNGGGAGSGIGNHGVSVNTAGSSIKTNSGGNLSITGFGGGTNGSGSDNCGVAVSAGTYISGSGSAMTVNGTGGDSSANSNFGIIVNGADAVISNSGNGTLNITGDGGGITNSAINYGVYVLSGGKIFNVDSTLAVTGTGGGAGTGANNYGVYVTGAGSTIKTTGSGNIVVTGTGGNASGSGGTNYGVASSTANGIQATGSGTISITGTGGNTSGSGSTNSGVYCGAATCIQPNSTGSLTITGVGGGSSNTANYGVNVGAGYSIIGAGAPMIITGTGGNSSGNSNTGVAVTGAGALISNSGTGTISITGNGAGRTNSQTSHGVLANVGGIISTVDGNLTVVGTGGGAGSGVQSHGVFVLDANSTIKTTGLGNLSVTGTGGNTSGTGNTNNGVHVSVARGLQATGSGTITVVGTGGAASGGTSYGIRCAAATCIQPNGTGSLTITGTGGAGSGRLNYGVYIAAGFSITGSGAPMIITGTGGNSSGNSNHGVNVTGTNAIISNSGAGTLSITANGGGNTTNLNFGANISLGGIISTANGDLTFISTGGGFGASGFQNEGFRVLDANSTIKTTGSGNLFVTGIGGVGAGSHGMFLYKANSLQATGSGTITITGSSTQSNSHGVWCSAVTCIQPNSTGSLTITGTGGVGTSYGVYVSAGFSIAGSGAPMTITGTGGNGTANGNIGVYVTGANAIISNSGTGTLSIMGTGRGITNSASDYGVAVTTAGVISTVDGNLTIEGTGGGAGTGANNFGVYVTGAGGTIKTTGLGNLSVTGTGGNASGSGNENNGVRINIANGIQATGSGTISVTGTGGNGSGSGNYNSGVYCITATCIQPNATGSLTITGTGGNSTGGINRGLQIDGSIVGAGASITISGTGGNKGDSSNGILVTGASAVVSNSGTGLISITGTVGGSGNGAGNIGVEVRGGGVVSTVNGSLTVSGQGGGAGSGANNYGVYIWGVGSTIKTTGSGNLTLTGIRGGGSVVNNYALVPGVANALQTTSTGNISLAVDKVAFNATNNINSAGNLTVSAYTPASTIGVGAGAGTLALSDTYIGYMTWGASSLLTIGSTTTGDIVINTASAALQNKNVTFITSSASTITLTSMLANTTAGTITFQGGTTALNTANSFYNLVINTTGNTATLGSALNVVNGLTISAGTLDVSASGCSSASCAVSVGGNWTNAGTFTPRTGTVTLTGTNQAISGSTTFYNLTKSVASSATLTFIASTTQTITHELTLNGATGQLLNLVSGTPGTIWNLNTTGATSLLGYLGVKDSNSTVGVSTIDSVNNGNNTNWTFSSSLFSCSTITDVPSAECEALMSIYDNTGGAAWTNQTGWGVSTTACSWYGVTCTNGHVAQIELYYNNLTGPFAVTAGNLDFLLVLYLSGNHLASFSGTGLTNLYNLGLDSNHLASFSGTGLAGLSILSLMSNQLTSFSGTGLTNLASLYLAGNQIASFSGTGLTNLSYLSLFSNQLASFSGTGLTNLNTLNLMSNQLTTFSSTGLTDKVTTLDLTNNLLTSFSDAGLPNLASLYLASNRLTSFSSTNPANLYQLNLSDNLLTSFSGNGFNNLDDLSLMSNQITSFSGTGLTNLRYLYLYDNQLISFSGTGLTNLRYLYLYDNQLISFSSADLTNLSRLYINSNLLTSFDGTGLPNLTRLHLQSNLITSFSSTDLANVGDLDLSDNQLRSFDATGLDYLSMLSLNGNLLANLSPSLSNITSNMYQGNAYFDNNCLSRDYTNAGVIDWLDSYTSGWENQNPSCPTAHPICMLGTDVPFDECEALMSIYDSTGGASWTRKDNWNASSTVCGSWYGVTCTDGHVSSLDLSSNHLTGSFIISSGALNSLTSLSLYVNQLTSFSGTGLDNLTYLHIGTNQLTSFDSTGLTNLIDLYLWYNQLTSFSGTGLDNLAHLFVSSNLLTSFSGTGLTNLTSLYIDSNRLPSFSGTGLTNLNIMYLGNNLLTSFSGTGMGNLTELYLSSNPTLTSFSGEGLDSLQTLYLHYNQLSSFDSTGLTNLNFLYLVNNKLTSFSGAGLTNLSYLSLDDNLLTSFSGVGLGSLLTLTLSNNQITSFNGYGLKALQTLYLPNNQLTDFNGSGTPLLTDLNINNNKLTSLRGTGLSGLTALDASNNRISSLSSDVTTSLTSIPPETASLSNNCLVGESLSPAIVNWLNNTSIQSNSVPTWSTLNAACPPAPGTMYFFGIDGNWNNTSNWYDENENPITLKLRPDAANNVIILSNVSQNAVYNGNIAVPASIKTLQVLGAAIISIPITNNGSASALTTTLTGSNNDIIWTPTDPDVTITYATPDAQATTTTVTVSGKDITVTPGAKAGMTVSGTLTGNGFPVIFPRLAYFNQYNGKPQYKAGITFSSSYNAGKWWLNDTWSRAYWTAVSGTENFPDEANGWAPNQYGVGTPTLTASASSASQVLAAVAANPTAAALLAGTLATGNDGTGAVTAMAKTSIVLTAATYAAPMSFLNTSTNNTDNVLTGDASFACTAQNLGFVTGTTTFTQCDPPLEAPTTNDPATDVTPTITGTCTPKTLVSLYNNTTTLIGSTLCTDAGTYSITPTLSTTSYSLTARHSNRKGAAFGMSADSPALVITPTCPNDLTWNGVACATACTTIEAPSELQANVDKPYIDCTGDGVTEHTHFKYRISNPGDATFMPVESGIYPVNSTERILHSTSLLPASSTDYQVSCIYGDSSMSVPVTDTSCTKSILVREATTENPVQGCDSIGNNYENTIGYEQWISTTPFNATITCNARKASSGIVDPFILGINGSPEVLGYLDELTDIGRYASALDVNTFDSGWSTSITCAVKVGDGYSTNSLCQNIACGGSDCALPSLYTITPEDEQLFCTKEAEISYTIGCASGSNGYAGCIDPATPENLYNGLTGSGTNWAKDLIFRVDGVEETNPRVMTCTRVNPQTNEDKTPHCTVPLPTGKQLEFKTGEIAQYQTIYDTIPRDTDAPTATISASDSSFESADKKTLSSTEWRNTPLTTTITCQNAPVEDNNACTCAWLIKESNLGTIENTEWNFSSPLKDIVSYQRIIRNETILNQSFYVLDNANNSLDDTKSKVTINLGVDMVYPSVTGTEVVDPLSTLKKKVTLTATDNTGGSGLWGEEIQYQVVNKDADPKTVFIDSKCNLSTAPQYAPFPETGAGFVGDPYTLPTSYNPLTEKIVYCVQDNAKNQLIGTWPFDPDSLIGCFSDGSQQQIPNLNENDSLNYYKPLLKSRIGSPLFNYGYQLTDSTQATPMTNFRTKLTQNIETFVKQQYCPTTSDFTNLRIDLGERITSAIPALQYAATIKNKDAEGGCSTTRNNNGYYYFKGSEGNRILEFSGVPRLSGQKVVVVEGADIYLGGDIRYLSRDSSLVIIAQKDSSGYGGNIYVHPEVTSIDATIIADGALMNGILDVDKNMVPKVWFNDLAGELKNPLTINGRLLTYNTRGGSLYNDGELLKVKLDDKTTGMCALNTASSPLNTTCNTVKDILPAQNPALTALDVAGLQDLERFRVVTRVPPESNNRCTLHVTGVMAMNRPEILTQVNL